MEFSDTLVTFGLVLLFSIGFVGFYGWGIIEYGLTDNLDFEKYNFTEEYTEYYASNYDTTVDQGQLTTTSDVGSWYTGAGIFLKNLLVLPQFSVLATDLFRSGLSELNVGTAIVTLIMTIIGLIFFLSVLNAFLRWRS
jgi:hypothetical protein